MGWPFREKAVTFAELCPSCGRPLPHPKLRVLTDGYVIAVSCRRQALAEPRVRAAVRLLLRRP